jgi:integrase
LLSPELVAGIRHVKGVPQLGRRVGNWLSAAEGEALLSRTTAETLRQKRDGAIISLLLGCGLRRSEVVALNVGDIQKREDHWAIVDLVGKAGHVRTVPVPAWVKTAVDRWTESAPVGNGRLFRPIRKNGTVWGNGITQNVVWYVVKAGAARAGITALAPHDLRRTCVRLCHAAGGELEQIQVLLGHASVRTTERYIGCKQNLTWGCATHKGAVGSFLFWDL